MSKPSLLIVDEDAYYAGIFANRFEAAGWKVLVTESIEDANNQLTKSVPDAVIIDPYGLDEPLKFLHELRLGEETSKCILMVLTELGDRELIREAESLGASGYFFKGHFFPSEAIKKLQRLVDERGRD